MVIQCNFSNGQIIENHDNFGTLGSCPQISRKPVSKFITILLFSRLIVVKSVHDGCYNLFRINVCINAIADVICTMEAFVINCLQEQCLCNCV